MNPYLPLLMAATSVMGAACTNTRITAVDTEPRFEPIEQCFAQPPAELELGLDMECGYVVVPEARNGHHGRMVKLGVMRLNSDHGTDHTPLFMLAGGPGQTQITTDILAQFLADPAAMLDTSCLQEARAPAFLLPDGSMSMLAFSEVAILPPCRRVLRDDERHLKYREGGPMGPPWRMGW